MLVCLQTAKIMNLWQITIVIWEFVGCGGKSRQGNIAERLNCNDCGFTVSRFHGFTGIHSETLKPETLKPYCKTDEKPLPL